jgi:Ca2+-binding RTX toxin-like protein
LTGSASRRRLATILSIACALALLATAAPASAEITPTRDAAAIAHAIGDPLPPDILISAKFTIIPPAPSDGLECSDDDDNDFDGLTDFPDDPGCSSVTDNQEQDDAPPECGDELDNDGDDAIDMDDPGCDFPGDNDESSDGLPPGGDPNPTATSDSPLTGFPFSGGTFAILTSGNSTFADDKNTSGSTSQRNKGGDGGHGGSFKDVVQLRVRISVPQNTNCLSVDFRFLSDEFPEFVGNRFNDAFIAELDASTFSADAAHANEIIAPNNFAFDGRGNVISLNTIGATEMSAGEAGGTTYDGATPRLRAAVPVTPGMHYVYFSIFDQGDDRYDSAVFLDNLALFSAPAGACKAGATPDVTPPDTTITAGPAQSSTTNDNTPTFEFTSTDAGSTFQCAVDDGAFASCDTPYTTAALTPGQHTFSVLAIDPAGNADLSSASRTFTVTGVDTTPPDTTITSGPAGSTNDNTPTFGFTSTEAGSTFECSIDNGPFAACDSPHTTAALSGGQHTSAVRAKDPAGNTDPTPATRTFTVTTAQPPPPPPPPGPKCNGVAATIVGTAGRDRIRGTNGRDVIVALGGKDKISGRGGNDLICAGNGDDKVDAGGGDDVVFGESGRDHLRGGNGDDRLDGGDGEDKLRGGGGNDRARGGDGKDHVQGDSGHDRIAGEGQRDNLSGASGNDRLNGGAERDRCRGGSGQNVLQSCES